MPETMGLDANPPANPIGDTSAAAVAWADAHARRGLPNSYLLRPYVALRMAYGGATFAAIGLRASTAGLLFDVVQPVDGARPGDRLRVSPLTERQPLQLLRQLGGTWQPIAAATPALSALPELERRGVIRYRQLFTAEAAAVVQ